MDTSVEHSRLRERLKEFLADAEARTAQLGNRSDREAAEELAASPLASAVQEAAEAAALANEYPTPAQEHSSGSPHRTRVLGPRARRFDVEAILKLGIAGVLRAGQDVDHGLLSTQLASYLAGPPIPIERFVVLDGNLGLSEPVDVATLRLHRLTRAELLALRPVPAAADYAPSQSWDPMLMFGWNWVLRHVDVSEKAQIGIKLFPEGMHRYVESTIPAWEALLVLNLYDEQPIHSVAEYVVEAGRRIDGGGNIPSTLATSERGEPVDVPDLRPFEIDEESEPEFRKFLIQMSQKLAMWPPAKLHRLKRSAMHFLRASDLSIEASGPIFVSDRPEVVYRYVLALEHLLLGDESSGIARTMAQRGAILAGMTDAERIDANKILRDAYKLRSEVAHGSEPSREIINNDDLIRVLRNLLRRIYITRIALSHDITLSTVSDRALLSKEVLDTEIIGPVRPYWEMANW